MQEKIKIGLVASGGGTDANSVMVAFRNGQLLSECDIVGLLSTKADAGCLEKAAAHDIPTRVIERHGRPVPGKGQADFEAEVSQWFLENEIQLVFLLGCIHRMPTNCWLKDHSARVVMYNIHPALPREHGGKGMYGLKPHKHVLAEVIDRLDRGQASPGEHFFTFPTVHEVTSEYDQGGVLLQAAVPIPSLLIGQARTDLEAAAKKLQDIVLPIEHLMLPTAVNIAARLI